VRRVLTVVFRPLRGRDLSLHAAAVTFYAGIAVVPAGLLAVWITGLIIGADRVRELTAPTIAALPDRIGAAHALGSLIEAGLHLTPLLALVTLLPATVYGEGLRRAFVSLRKPGGETLAGWRGRILWLPVLAALPALLLALFLGLPVTSDLWTRGGWHAVLAVIISFLATWLVLSPVVIWIFRGVAPGRREWVAANLSGFVHGAVLFSSLPLDLGAPFGGFDQVGGVVAIGLWLYLFHVVLLTGYAATDSIGLLLRVRAQTRTDSRSGSASGASGVSRMP
jgi:membrane protein